MHKTGRKILLTAGILIAVGLLTICGTYLVLFFMNEKALDDIGNDSVIFEKEISGLKIDMAYGNLIIAEGDEFKIDLSNVYLPGVECSYDDGIVTVRQSSPADISLWGWRFGLSFGHDSRNSCRIKITIPSDTHLDHFCADLGRASFTADSISADRFVLQAGISSLYIGKLKIDESAAVQLGSGDLTINSCLAGSLSVKQTFGDMNITLGEALGKYSIDAASDVGICAIGAKKDYGINASRQTVGTGYEMKLQNVIGKISISE